MALDFDSYLLSSSPPGFEFIRLKNFDFSSENDGDFPRCRKKDLNDNVNGFETDFNSNFNLNDLIKDHCSNVSNSKTDGMQWQNIQLIDDRTRVPNRKPFDQTRISDWEHAYNCDSENCDCVSKKWTGKVKRKNVTFADDLGQELAEVRVMQESSDVPPILSAEVLGHFSCSPANSVVADSDAVVCLAVNFPQPAANYLAFREKVEKSRVSLENAVARGLQVFGTIKVLNHSYNKRVFVRCTFDSWESFVDHAAKYSNSNNACFDTFSFQIDVPTDLDRGKSIQFAVCYVSDEIQFWDNNDGKNYEVTHYHRTRGEDSRDGSDHGAFALDRKDSWSNFTGWSEEGSNPYW